MSTVAAIDAARKVSKMTIDNKVYFRGIAMAARESGVCMSHVRRCAAGERKPSARVADAIKKYVVAYEPIRLDEHTTRDKDTNVT